MIVDSSAIVAIAFGEPDQQRLLRALAAASRVRVAAPTWLETSIVLARLADRAAPILDGISRQFDFEIIPFDAEHAGVALAAWRQFGRGQHPAALNFGDCISYAAARIADEPLLFVGDDFGRTDITAA